MGKYLHLFETESAFNTAYNGETYEEPWVSYTEETEGQEHVDYNKENMVIVNYYHRKYEGASFVTVLDEVIGYKLETPIFFADMFEPAFRHFGTDNSVTCSLYDGENENDNRFGYGFSCYDHFIVNNLGKDKDYTGELPWDWETGKFREDMGGKVISIYIGGSVC